MSSTIVTEKFTLDTNILIYAADASNAEKHKISVGLLRRLTLERAALPMQCLSEFYASTVRKGLLSKASASASVIFYSDVLEIVPSSLEDFRAALEMSKLHNFQFFDLLIWAVAERAGCTVFLTEDMQHQRVLGNVLILNPFKLEPAELARFIF